MTTSKSLVIKCFTAPWCLRQLIFDQSAKWVGLICVKKKIWPLYFYPQMLGESSNLSEQLSQYHAPTNLPVRL